MLFNIFPVLGIINDTPKLALGYAEGPLTLLHVQGPPDSPLFLSLPAQ
jgi:hypothetical protein